MFNLTTTDQIKKAIEKSIEESKKAGTLGTNPFVKLYNERLVK